MLFLFPVDGLAAKLDIFQTKKSFPTDFLFKENIPDLERLDQKEADSLLKFFLTSESNLKKREEKNLLHLAAGYLYLFNDDLSKALEHLDQNIKGNFILEDYRLNYVAQVLRASAEKLIQEKKYEASLDPLGKANQIYLTLFRAYPDSPLQEQLPRMLAECQKLLGDAHFYLTRYRAAWQWYRKSLMREFSLNEEHQQEVYLSLARTYSYANNFDEAVDIYIHLLSQHNNASIAQNEAGEFLKKYQKQLEKEKIRTAGLESLLSAKSNTENGNNKSGPQKPRNTDFQNEKVKLFYAALSKNDFTEIFKSAEVVLRDYPGIKEGRGVIPKTNQKIYGYFHKGNPWNPDLDAVLKQYPVKALRALGFLLWRNQLTDAAARVYEAVLQYYPAQIESAHMSLYFLGRIHEDLHQYKKSIQYYKSLVGKYDHGEYAASARFKIPWLYRLSGQLEKAEKEFEALLIFYDETFQSSHVQDDNGFIASARYWLAQTRGELGKNPEKEVELHKLVELHPMSFYSVLARLELAMDPLSFLKNEDFPKPASREPGLGEIGRKHLNRAEKLIAIGFLRQGLDELSEVTHGQDNKEFLFYLSRLFLRAGGFQRSIGISWSLSQDNNHDSIPFPVMETLFPKAYIERVKSESKSYGIDPYLVLALMRQESAFNSRITSSANAVGLMQLIPPTANYVAKSLGQSPPKSDDLKDPDLNIQLGVKYLNQLLKTFDDNPVFALAAYNAGPHKIKRWIQIRSSLKPMEFIESIPYTETRDYVKKVLRNYVIYKTLYEKKNPSTLDDVLSVRK